MTAAAPSGVVTFLFTDVEGSTGRWESDADGMRAALAAHDEVMTPVIKTSDVNSVESRTMVVLQTSAE
jgi:class 3 adenylate cyclase